jgi:ABC-2 type transport system ATP-binding protein
MNEMPLVLSQITKSYGDFKAVDNVSFKIGSGEIFGLLGPNGAGKTSIISMITTLESISSGSLQVFGREVEKEPLWIKSKIGVVAQEVVNHGFFDVSEILEFQSGYYGLRKNKERIDYLLNKLSLWEHRSKKVKQLSGGMKRRLMIAKALVHSPKLLLLDEPTAGVDIELRECLWDFVVDLQKEGTSILLTTHYLEEAESLCQRVGIIHKGQIRYTGETREIIAQLTQRHVKITLTKNRQLANTAEFMQNVGRCWEYLIPSQKTLGELFAELAIAAEEIEDINVTEGDLEEAFIKVLGGGQV